MIVRAREAREVCVRLCLRGMSEDTPLKYHQNDYLNMSRTWPTPIDMFTWMRESSQVLNPTKRTTGNQVMLRAGKQSFPTENTLTGYPIPSPENKYILGALCRLNRVYLYV